MVLIPKKWRYLLSIKKFDIYEIQQGDCILIDFRKNEYIYFIAQGFVKLNQVFTNTNKLTLGIFTANDVINMTNTKTNTINYYYSVEGISSALIISYDYKKILLQLGQHLLICHELLLAQQKYIHQRSNMIQILSHRDKKSRLVNLLLILCKLSGMTTRFGIIINLSITHNTLGTIIGSSRTIVTKTLISLQQCQLLSIYNNKLLIHDPISLSLYYKALFYTKNLP